MGNSLEKCIPFSLLGPIELSISGLSAAVLVVEAFRFRVKGFRAAVWKILSPKSWTWGAGFRKKELEARIWRLLQVNASSSNALGFPSEFSTHEPSQIGFRFRALGFGLRVGV